LALKEGGTIDMSMQNFIYDIPTKVFFWRNQLGSLPEVLLSYGARPLLLYGGGSVRRAGLYDKITTLLRGNGLQWREMGGIEPNPRVSTVRKGIAFAKENGADVLLPVGGGSTIDCAKAISAGMYYDGDPWDLCLDRTLIRDGLPIVCVPTMAATGSEMDPIGVITNEETNDKKSLAALSLFPAVSFSDPENTFTVSAYQTASGVADIISHVLETYFHVLEGAYIQRRLCEAILRTCFHYGKIAIEEPENYDARANVMWAAAWAINGLLKCGFTTPWVAHAIEHQLSAYYDIPHGVGLSILTPHWFRTILKQPTSLEAFHEYGTNVFGIDSGLPTELIAERAIDMTERFFFDDMRLPRALREAGIPDRRNFDVMVDKSLRDGAGKTFFPLSREEILGIYEAAF
jgi:alcohol dehydrogenase YqhD (iron-dependent ADH family)